MIPRPSLLPRARLLKRCLNHSNIPSPTYRSSRLPPLLPPSTITHRHVSYGTPSTLEKPTRYNPPSHPTRINQPPSAPPRNYPGPPSPKSPPGKRYPNTFPDEGSFMHWFLTTRWIHLCITLGTLCTLGAITFHLEFHRKSPYAKMLPPASDLFWHPISFISTYIRVFKLDVEHTSAVTAQRRKKKVDDVVKRNEYRKAHGLDKKEGFGGWTTREGIASDSPEEGADTASPLTSLSAKLIANANENEDGKNGSETHTNTNEAVVEESGNNEGAQVVTTRIGGGGEGEERVEEEEGRRREETAEEAAERRRRQRVYKDAEGHKRPLKMWFGIW